MLVLFLKWLFALRLVFVLWNLLTPFSAGVQLLCREVPLLSGFHANFVSAYVLRAALAEWSLSAFPLPAIEVKDRDAAHQGPVAVGAICPLTSEAVVVPSDSDSGHDGEPKPVEPSASASAASVRGSTQPSQLVSMLAGPVISPQLRKFQDMSHAALVKLCAKKEGQITVRDKRISRLKGVLKKQKRQANRSEKRLVQYSEKLACQVDSFAIKKLGKQKEGRGGRLSLPSVFSIGLRRCLTHCAALDWGVITLQDISAQTIIRAEMKTASGLIFAMQSFCAEAMDVALRQHQLYMDASGTEDAQNYWSCTTMSYRTDATNSSCWRRKKLQVLESTVMYLKDDTASCKGSFQAAMASRRCVWRGYD